MLVFTTLTAWLADVGVARASIGFFSWVGITYSIKVLWAPVVDRMELPLLGRWLGKRRSWMLLAQFMIAGGLVGMAMTDPLQNLIQDRKSTRLNSSHVATSYAVFCLKK